MNMLVDVDFQKNVIYVCYLVSSLGDNLSKKAIINDRIFDANFNKAIKLIQQHLDEYCRQTSIEATYVTCQEIWRLYQ